MAFINLLDIIYPINSIYMSFNNTSPAELIGGSWTQIVNRCLRAGTNINTGGSDTHTLTINEMPSHSHEIWGWEYLSGSTYKALSAQSSVNYAKNTSAVGGSQPHNNLPAYQNVYMWRRIS